MKTSGVETGKLTDEVVTLEIKSAKDFEGLTSLFKKIFNFLLYKNKELTSEKSESAFDSQAVQFNIEKEVAAGLESVIPRAALGPFVSLNPSEKVTQLVELSNLVIGIRLFNKWIQKGQRAARMSFISFLNRCAARRWCWLNAFPGVAWVPWTWSRWSNSWRSLRGYWTLRQLYCVLPKLRNGERS